LTDPRTTASADIGCVRDPPAAGRHRACLAARERLHGEHVFGRENGGRLCGLLRSTGRCDRHRQHGRDDEADARDHDGVEWVITIAWRAHVPPVMARWPCGG
jgi:hypothetical protein